MVVLEAVSAAVVDAAAVDAAVVVAVVAVAVGAAAGAAVEVDQYWHFASEHCESRVVLA